MAEDNANELYFLAALRHQVAIRRYTTHAVKETLRLLELADRELAQKLAERLGTTLPVSPTEFTSMRWRRLLDDMASARKTILAELERRTTTDLAEQAVIEAKFEENMLKVAIPVEVTFAAVSLDQLRAAVEAKPFQGKLLGQWFESLAAGDRDRLLQAIQLGVAQGETIPQVIRRVIGTKANNYADGVLSITRRNAEAVVRTAINHTSNEAREAVWEANQDIVAWKRWSSTLDGRTSAICRARDGKGIAVGTKPLPGGVDPVLPRGAKPPAHVNCRSVLVAVIDGVGILGNRPFVVDTRRREQREVDFREIAKKEGKDIRTVRREWADRNIGRVPATTTYQEFLKKQSPKFQDEVLGEKKGKLFREGGLKVDQFVDRAGNELSLDQLRQTQPEAWRRAGL
jgi:hypothetical protein